MAPTAYRIFMNLCCKRAKKKQSTNSCCPVMRNYCINAIRTLDFSIIFYSFFFFLAFISAASNCQSVTQTKRILVSLFLFLLCVCASFLFAKRLTAS